MDVASPASTSEASLPLRPAANNNKNTTNNTKSEALPAAPAKEVKSVEIYTATYSGTQVFEMSVGDVDIMRRRSDSYLNATQLLKLSGCEKGKRTKILEREVLTGNHEKIQGGYGKYQGTWVPLEIGRELAQRYQVLDKVLPLIEFDTNTWDDLPEKQAIPAKMMLPSSKAKKFTLADIDSPPPSSPCPTASPLWDSQDTFDPQTPLLAFLSQTDSQDVAPPNTPKRKNEHDNDDDATSEKKRPKKSSDTKKKYTPSDKSQELLSSKGERKKQQGRDASEAETDATRLFFHDF
ncbi:transcription regulator HTH, apses-type DNA-binding domain-containing protein [Gongronella butleri]|nr:transcription regulator HTH, apses-type DNA-binding domain-containing protein [Gongronella butleri]